MSVVQVAQLQADRYQDAHVEVVFATRMAMLDGRRLDLTRKEYDLLAVLVENAAEIVRREDLLLRVWGYGGDIRTRTLDVHIRRLRKKLGAYADQYIETIFGVGYRFQPYRQPRYGPSPVMAVSA